MQYDNENVPLKLVVQKKHKKDVYDVNNVSIKSLKEEEVHRH